MNDKVTFHYPPAPDASPTAPKDYSAQSSDLKVSNYPYSLENCNHYLKLPPTPKKQKNMKIDEKVTFYYPPSPNDFSMFPLSLIHNNLYQKFPNLHFH